MEPPDRNRKKTHRSNSMFYSPTTSEDEIIPKKFRRIRSRHAQAIRNSKNEVECVSSPSRYNTHNPRKLNIYDKDEGYEANNQSTNDISLQGYPKEGTTSFDSPRIHLRNNVQPTTIPERNESIWSFSSFNTTNRLLEDVEIIKELIFLRDIQLGFLPDDYETEFESCFRRLSMDERFAVSTLSLLVLHIR
jgi:alpha-galactosidase